MLATLGHSAVGRAWLVRFLGDLVVIGPGLLGGVVGGKGLGEEWCERCERQVQRQGASATLVAVPVMPGVAGVSRRTAAQHDCQAVACPVCARMPVRMSEDMPGRLAEDTPKPMSEYTPDRMPERM